MGDIPEFTQYNGEKRIALLDNSALAFMHQLDLAGYAPDVLFQDYELIAIPGWVREEINDSAYRCQYVERLIITGFPIFWIDERKYVDLIDQKEIFLFKIVEASASLLPDLLRYLRQNVQKEDMLDLEPAEEWMQTMYDHWPLLGKTAENGRQTKKNAGEISLTILAEIFSWFHSDIECLTIFTQDTDTYHFQKRAEEKLKKFFDTEIPVSVTYKSNDFILWQLFQEGYLSLEDICVQRKDSRTVVYAQRQPDRSFSLLSKVLTNTEFTSLIANDAIQIIF